MFNYLFIIGLWVFFVYLFFVPLSWNELIHFNDIFIEHYDPIFHSQQVRRTVDEYNKSNS